MLSPSVMDMNGDIDNDYDQNENSNSESDFHNQAPTKNSQKPKRGRPPKFEATLAATPELHDRRRGNYNHPSGLADSKDGYSSTEEYDDEKEERPNPKPNRSGFLEPGEIRPPQSKGKSGDDRSSSTKRGRKSSVVYPKSPPQQLQPGANNNPAGNIIIQIIYF